MSPNFSWLNFITNALNLASNEPDSPDILLQFLGQLTGQRLARVESNDGDVPSSGDLPTHQSDSCPTSPGVTLQSEDKMNEVDSDSSFHSCSSGNTVVGSLAMHDNADSARFPQGNLPPYVVKDPMFRLSWTMMTYGRDTKKNKEKVKYQCCMGIYKCPTEGCNFVQNAVAPRTGKANGAKPTHAKGSGMCTKHKLQLEHVPCSATCTVYNNNSSVTIHHYGKHKHARPSEKVSKEALARLENMMNINNNAKPV